MKRLSVFILIALFILQLSANDLLTISWENLIPEMVEFEDPFEKLGPEQLSDLSLMVRVKALDQKNPQRVSNEMRREIFDIEKSLLADGIDVEGLLAQREKIGELRRVKAESVNSDLNKKNIRMAGYLLPLEYSGKKVTEFLMVPWVGACIHTPPPPINQIIYVKYDKGFAVNSRYMPVWVSGVIQTQAATSNLFLIDGSSEISSGYTLDANQIENYIMEERLGAK